MKNAKANGHQPVGRQQQSGAALLLLLLALIGVGFLFGLGSWLDDAALRSRQQEKNRLLLAEAKEALLGYVAGKALNPAWPGDLPCPDGNDDGVPDTPCSLPADRLGRLPWKTLNFGDRRDAAGGRLWYAVSKNFVSNPRVSPRNSDTAGTLRVLDANGNVIDTEAVAVIFAPGVPVQRLDGFAQSRAPGANDPRHWLDNASFEDNAQFQDNSTDGLFLGPVKDASGNTIANDEAIVISRKDLDRAMRQRVAGEVRRCLASFRASYGALPWLVPLTDTTTYASVPGTAFGRLPLSFSTSGVNWPGDCYLNAGAWWANWREQVFAAIDPACAPGGTGCPASCSLVVNGQPGQCLAVFVAGRSLTGQNRGVPANLANFLENGNYDGGAPASPYATCDTATCNDWVVSWRP